jgi:hypothetical protein
MNMINSKSVLCENSFIGKVYISVDIQPEYATTLGFSMESYTTFLNENYD